jgi:hypothetical protein
MPIDLLDGSHVFIDANIDADFERVTDLLVWKPV